MSIVVSFGSIANDRIPVTLNVQAFKFVGKATADLTENEVWTTFDQLRNLKNLAFESCITDKVREEFR